jgi:4-diphosphocytidyl-2-C-methyl-D-erythritol kinase
MNSFLFKSYCKVNIGLQIRNKREDGYHNLHTVFQELDLHDNIKISKLNKGWNLSVNNPKIPTDDTNTCIKAYNELKKEYPSLGGIYIEIDKRIPSGGGLGGGSGDAATVLKGINKIYDLKISDKDLVQIAVRIGADVAFFIKGGTQIGDGIGEVLSPVAKPVSGYYLLILPDIFINTKWAYKSMKKYLDKDVDRPNFAHFLERKNLLQRIFDNDFERVVIPTYPEIGDIKNGLKKAGASYASLSGSGSTVFGIFNDEAKAKNAEFKFREQYHTFLTKPTNI